MLIFLILITGMLSASLASFFGVVAYRGSIGKNINGRSYCACGRPLQWYENVPVFGWLRVRGKAKCCGSSISPILFITEVCCFLSGAVLGTVIYLLLVGSTSVSIALVALICTGGIIATAYVALKRYYAGDK